MSCFKSLSRKDFLQIASKTGRCGRAHRARVAVHRLDQHGDRLRRRVLADAMAENLDLPAIYRILQGQPSGRSLAS